MFEMNDVSVKDCNQHAGFTVWRRGGSGDAVPDVSGFYTPQFFLSEKTIGDI